MSDNTLQNRVKKIVADLFINGIGEKADRLVLTSKGGRDLGGWCEQAIVDRIVKGLAEYPTDDGEPVTEEWLSATFGPHLPSGPWKRYALLLASRSGLDVAWCPTCGDLAPCLMIGTSVIKANPSRGDVRRLCAALDIELKGRS